MAVKINTLYSSAKKGDTAAEEELFRYLSDRFRYSIHRKVENEHDAEELVQDALMTVLREYREIEITTSFAAWVFKIVDNKILNYWGTRKRTRGRSVSLEDSDEQPAKSEANLDLKRQLLQCLKRLGDLKIRHARVIVLNSQGYSSDEICKRMSLTRNAFYLLLSRARTMLADCLAGRSSNS
jgi:RNA polymerase sigma factor (sigma-70 family)